MPKITPEPKALPPDIRITNWRIVNERKGGIVGYLYDISIDAIVKVELSDGTTQKYIFRDQLGRKQALTTREYILDKDISLVYQYVRRHLIKEGLYRGRKGRVL